MKQRFFSVFCALFVTFASQAFAQKKLPEISLSTLDNQTIKASDLINLDGATIISFWATWCKPCMQELNNISEVYADWQKETGVKLIAISTDDARSAARVPTVVKTKKWAFDVYIDANQDLMRSLQVLNIPHTFILNSKGEIIYQHPSYKVGDEEEYFEIIKKIKEEMKEDGKKSKGKE